MEINTVEQFFNEYKNTIKTMLYVIKELNKKVGELENKIEQIEIKQ